jgi:hypothetical protein
MSAKVSAKASKITVGTTLKLPDRNISPRAEALVMAILETTKREDLLAIASATMWHIRGMWEGEGRKCPTTFCMAQSLADAMLKRIRGEL